MVKLICDKRDELLVLESYKLLENGFQTILVDSFNTYMTKLNIPYQVSNTDQINWQYIFNNIEDVPMDFLSTFYNIIDWEKFARWGQCLAKAF
jgi:nucleosome binding factor SPN SPT16 subunit